MRKKGIVFITIFAVLCAAYQPVWAEQQNLSPDASYDSTVSRLDSTVTNEQELAAAYKGSIVPALISVAIPTEISFGVDPSLNLEGHNYNQAINANDDSLTVKNDGVDLKISVVGIEKEDQAVRGRGPDDVAGTADDRTYPFQFVESLERINTLPEDTACALVSIRAKDDRPSDAADLAGKAITHETVGEGKSVEITTIPGGQSKILNIFCVVATNYKIGGFSFSMTPLIKVEYDKYTGNE